MKICHAFLAVFYNTSSFSRIEVLSMALLSSVCRFSTILERLKSGLEDVLKFCSQGKRHRKRLNSLQCHRSSLDLWLKATGNASILCEDALKTLKIVLFGITPPLPLLCRMGGGQSCPLPRFQSFHCGIFRK
ncbi:hypothetical protein JTE90_022362 [Oedothorax gibbosus]|uniref:Uncharacterized protein n=1 Tax=Oedothorax gibbosus TaxID=931172 RepID=A0AAV6ULV3_9ARAC|nr:hypothetical protein JTE90_022362 [Oedothorax gibbosus]